MNWYSGQSRSVLLAIHQIVNGLLKVDRLNGCRYSPIYLMAEPAFACILQPDIAVMRLRAFHPAHAMVIGGEPSKMP
jgi:hypothetical protein